MLPPPPPLRAPRAKLRPFFWTKAPARAGTIWERVPPPAVLAEPELAALERLFAATAPATPAKAGAAPGAPCRAAPRPRRLRGHETAMARLSADSGARAPPRLSSVVMVRPHSTVAPVCGGSAAEQVSWSQASLRAGRPLLGTPITSVAMHGYAQAVCACASEAPAREMGLVGSAKWAPQSVFLC